MQLILDAEATIGIQSKMSGIDEEILDGNVAKNLVDNVSNDLPHNGSGALKDISLISNDKKKELLENLTTSNNSYNTKENVQFTTSKNNTKENEKSFGVYGKESIDHQSSINAGENKKAFVDDDIQSDETQKSLAILNNECSTEEDALNDTNRNITNSAELENVLPEDITEHKEICYLESAVKHKIDEEQFLKETQNHKMCNFENEVENKIDEEAVLEDVADNKKCNFENEAENKIDEEAILEDVADNDNMCNFENEAENKIDEEAILDDVADNDKMRNFGNEAKNKIDEEAILEDVADNDIMCNFENEAENKIDEEAILEDIADSDKMCNFENEAQNKIDEEAILEDVADNDKICNFENEAQNKIDEEAILEDIGDADTMCNFENEAENKIDEEAILNDVENYKICNLENKTDVDAVLDKVVVNDNKSHLEIKAENEIDEDAVLGEVVENDKISNLEIKVKNKLYEDSVLEEGEEVVVNDNTSKVENIQNDEADLVDVFENDNISNLENKLENKLDENSIFENNDKRKNEQGCIIENITRDDENLNCLNDDDLNSSGEREKNMTHNEESLAKDEISMLNLPSDQSDQRNSKSYPAEKAEESKLTEKTEEKREPIEMKMPSTDEQTSEKQDNREKENHVKGKDEKPSKEIKKLLHSKLSNTLNILSDDEDNLPDIAKVIENVNNYNHSISLVDDDDVMLIEDDTGENEENITQVNENISEVSVKTDIKKQCLQPMDISGEDVKPETVPEEMSVTNESYFLAHYTKTNVAVKPLLPLNVLKSYKKNLADMTREELEEFCISKIVESVVDRSNLGDIKAQLKVTARTVEEYKKKLMMISKQTRDFQVILKSVQQEQMKPTAYPITPLKLTRSVGMQVFMTHKPISKKRQQSLILSNNSPLDKSNRNNTANIKTPKNNQQIPVPRLVPAATPATKATSIPQVNNAVATKSPQTNNSLVNGLRNSPPAQKAEKRTRMQTYNTVDLTDDEPPSKIVPKSSPTQPVRLVPPQNLLAPQRQPFPPINSPRKVYIPISSPQTQNIRPGQTYLLKSVPPSPGPRPRAPTNGMPKMQPNSIRMNRPPNYRHPAPLPDAMKQYQPPNWKALPPAPDLKLTKADNGIIISWTIDGYPGDSYEEVSSYQLFAYQESASPPSTALWKKIGDVKALPLPMACTLTQFLAGFKYYFAVRAVDVKSRLGPFSSPGSILLLNEL